jgi:molybdate transport system regulatory protein
MKYGARNQLTGEIVGIKRGTVMCQVKVKIADGALLTSVMTLDSLAELGIQEGSRVTVLVKAVNVLLAAE